MTHTLDFKDKNMNILDKVHRVPTVKKPENLFPRMFF